MSDFYFQIACKYQHFWVKHIISIIKETPNSKAVIPFQLRNSYLDNWIHSFKEENKFIIEALKLHSTCNSITKYNDMFNKIVLKILNLKNQERNDEARFEFDSLEKISEKIANNIKNIQLKIRGYYS
ncbi:MAG: hypothetical protein A2275_05395 [Bacteroidetes bacterium RIFOXYA12_FULL_35_11]|nr:MAG: hypothetical protein A2X01_10735 [Bacteroidetes bacterium GWF2_35_48]OFY73824.1 MAG: hypothetical protein A2275_05395 [Bacteroidetes bacterium RIFOXYA12_FULL_35_11]HBX50418.1 hypothetical protein [Bacteroidales bacterium]